MMLQYWSWLLLLAAYVYVFFCKEKERCFECLVAQCRGNGACFIQTVRCGLCKATATELNHISSGIVTGIKLHMQMFLLEHQPLSQLAPPPHAFINRFSYLIFVIFNFLPFLTLQYFLHLIMHKFLLKLPEIPQISSTFKPFD